MQEIRTELIKLRDRLGEGTIKHLYTDNPWMDKNIFREIFGANLTISKDLFHVMQDLYAPCKKSDLRAAFMGAVSRAFTTVEQDDIELIVKGILLPMEKPLEEGVEAKVRAEVVKNQKKYSNRLRKYVRDKEEICTALDKAYEQFAWKGCFHEAKMLKRINMVKKLVREGYMEDKADVIYYNIGTVERPKYITVRGTGQLESYHRCLRKIFHGVHVPIKAHLLTLDFTTRWNLKKQKTIRKQEIPSDVYDLELLNRVHRLQSKLNLESLPVVGWSPVKKRVGLPAIGMFGAHTATNAVATWEEYKKECEEAAEESFEINMGYIEAMWPEEERSIAAKAQGLPCHVGPVKTKDEMEFLKALMRRPDFMRSSELKTTQSNQNFEQTMWAQINRSGTDLANAFDWTKMATFWNRTYLDVIGNGETHIHFQPRCLTSKEERKIAVTDMTMKEVSHLKSAAKTYAAGVSVNLALRSDPYREHLYNSNVQAQKKPKSHGKGKAPAAPKIKSSLRSVKRQVAAAAVPNVNALQIWDSVHKRKRQKKGARVKVCRKVCPDPKCAIIITSRGTHADGCRFKAFRGRAKVTRAYPENLLDAYIREFRTRFASTLPPSQSPSTPAEGTPAEGTPREHNL